MSLLPELQKTAKQSILGGGTQPLRSPKLKMMGENWDDFNVGYNLLLFGSPGSGKTHFLAKLVELGEKVMIIGTDAGGNVVINTIKANLIRAKKEAAPEWLRTHLRFVHVPVGEQVGEGRDALSEWFKDVQKDPEHDFWKFAPTVLVWEGFSTYQGSYIVDEFDDSEGAVENFKQWGKIKTATIRDSESFFKVAANKFPSMVRIMTCLEGTKKATIKVGTDKDGKPITDYVIQKTGAPQLQTNVKDMFNAAFDGIIRMDREGDKFIYEIVTEGKSGKQRVVLPPKMEADPEKLWREFKTQLGI